MKLYERIWYPEKKVEVVNRSVVEILTSDKRASIDRGYYDEWFEEQRTRPFAVNYAWRIGDCSPVLRGFQFEGKLYEIDSDGKVIIVQSPRGNIFYDHDKTIDEDNDFVFEGSLDEFVAEFVKTGYQIRER